MLTFLFFFFPLPTNSQGNFSDDHYFNICAYNYCPYMNEWKFETCKNLANTEKIDCILKYMTMYALYIFALEFLKKITFLFLIKQLYSNIEKSVMKQKKLTDACQKRSPLVEKNVNFALQFQGHEIHCDWPHDSLRPSWDTVAIALKGKI